MAEEIAAQVAALMDGGVAPESAYHVTLDENGDLLWTTEIDGKEVRYRSEPETSLWRRITIRVLKLLPIEEQL
jgi:putative cardiolipin synthase